MKVEKGQHGEPFIHNGGRGYSKTDNDCPLHVSTKRMCDCVNVLDGEDVDIVPALLKLAKSVLSEHKYSSAALLQIAIDNYYKDIGAK